MVDIFDEYAEREWVYAIVGLSNLLGRLDVLREGIDQASAAVAAETWRRSPHLQDLWYAADADLDVDRFLDWFGRIGNSVVVDGVTEMRDGRRRRTLSARKLVNAMSGLVVQEDSLDDVDYQELVSPQIERFVKSLRGIDGAVANLESIWDELIDPSELAELIEDLNLTIDDSGHISDAFRNLLSIDIVRQIKAAASDPFPSLLTQLIKAKYRQQLAAALGTSEEFILTRLVLKARAHARSQSTDDLFAAERTRIRIMELIRAASHGVLTVLQQAQQQDGEDSDDIAMALTAGLLCVRRNYRQAVKVLTGLEDTYDTFSAAHADSLLETLRTHFARFLERMDGGDDIAAEPLTRQLALVLEAIGVDPFERDDLDLTSQALRDPDRFRLLLPLSDQSRPPRMPISREEFIGNLKENLTKDGVELIQV